MSYLLVTRAVDQTILYLWVKPIYIYGNKVQREQSKLAGRSAKNSMLEILSSQSGLSMKDKTITSGKKNPNGRRIITKTTKQRLIFLAHYKILDNLINGLRS